MKYVSLDLETTGLDPKISQVLQIAMVLEDTNHQAPVAKLPHFNQLMLNEVLQGSWYAMFEMNRDLIERCQKEGAHPASVWCWAQEWLEDQGYSPTNRAVLAGKNVGTFDWHFLPESLRRYFHHRVIDPGSMFIDWSQDAPPSLGDLLYPPQKVVRHDALSDARDVISVLRRSYACNGCSVKTRHMTNPATMKGWE